MRMQCRQLAAWLWPSLLLGTLVVGQQARSDEHPKEHPAGTEHPEHPKEAAKDKAASELTIADLSKAIASYVKEDTKLKGGYFLVFDPVAKTPLPLVLDKVHEERLSHVGGDVFFACADFKDPQGKVYDLDVFMLDMGGKLVPSEIRVHKEAGKPRYDWYEEGGVWKTREAK